MRSGSNHDRPVRMLNSHAVPRAAHDVAGPPALVLAGSRPGDRAPDLPLAQRPALVRAAVAQREELAVDVEDADRATPDLDDLAPARRDLADRATTVVASHRRDRYSAWALSRMIRRRRSSPRARGIARSRRVEVPVRVVGREHDPVVHAHLVEQHGRSAVRSGSSIGWVVSHTCSRMTSDGRRSSFGASDPSSAQARSIRHMSGASQATPPSMSTIRSPGISSKTPSKTRLVTCVLERRSPSRPGPRGRTPGKPVPVIGPPAPAAEVDADRQAALRRGAVQRPVLAAPERLGGADEHEHLHEARVVGAAGDLARGELAVLVGDVDRRAQPRLRVEPLGHLPVVDRRRERRARLEVELLAGAEHRGQHAVLDVVAVQELLAQEREVRRRRRAVGRPCVGARRARRRPRGTPSRGRSGRRASRGSPRPRAPAARPRCAAGARPRGGTRAARSRRPARCGCRSRRSRQPVVGSGRSRTGSQRRAARRGTEPSPPGWRWGQSVANMSISGAPSWSTTCASCAASGGPSTGCRPTRTCSRT